MMNTMIAGGEEIAVGDRVLVLETVFPGEVGVISAEVIEIRRILGGLTYLIETEKAERRLVSANQIRQVEVSSQ